MKFICFTTFSFNNVIIKLVVTLYRYLKLVFCL